MRRLVLVAFKGVEDIDFPSNMVEIKMMSLLLLWLEDVLQQQQ